MIKGLKVSTLFLTIASALLTFSTSAKTNPTATTSIVAKAAQLAPYAKRSITDEVFYFVLPDRFYNGDSSNDLGAKLNDKKRAESRGGFDKSNKGMYHGGDLKGLTAKLPYLDNMGITAIWLTPILRNRAVQAGSAGYHGYWILDFTEIDPHFGTNADLQNFIKAAHQRNIKVFFDIITNHTADVIKYKECHGDDGLGWLISTQEKNKAMGCPYISTAELAQGKHYTPIIPKGDEKLKFPTWLNDPKYYHNQGDSTWQGESSQNGDFSGLDDLKTEDQFVVNGFIDIYEHIIDKFKPDGFRIDTVKHVNIEFWSQFAPALVNHAKNQGIDNFFMFGEVYSAEPKYLSRFTTQGKMQSVLDFGFQQAIVDTLIKQQGTNKLAQLFAQDHYYNDKDSNASELINFISNHDMGRFAYRLKQEKHNYNEEEKIARLKLATALMFFTRGVPVIYYGDEQGFVGDGGDQNARQDMMPSLVNSYNNDNLLANNKTTADDNFDRNNPLYKTFSEYAKLYQQHSALRNGQQITLYSQAKTGLFVFTKTNQQEKLLIIVNTAKTEQQVSLRNQQNQYKKITGTSDFVYDKAKNVTITQPALSFSIYIQL
ncbi:MAG: alpha-amylase [Alteromonadaceae bacterium]|nr:alpha-amylase [Alteromonadaceae bacterium]